ncbi:MAG: hypothetical protein L0287_13010 [Anaerolineae bacterium]|nr:hypothetical protein [Anaerolineae bacterium]
MKTMQIIAFGFALLTFGVGYWLSERRMFRKKRERIEPRADMNPEEFYATYYAQTGIPKRVVTETLEQIAKATGIPLTKLRPSDNFNKELAPMQGWEFGDGIVEIDWLLQRKMKDAGVTEKIEINTIDELIRYLAELEIRSQKG